MGIYNHQRVPSSYHDIFEEYKAVRENALLVDYSHMSITSVMGDDAWALVNYMVSADVSIIRDEQGIYSHRQRCWITCQKMACSLLMNRT